MIWHVQAEMEAGDFDRFLDEAEATIIRIAHTSADVLFDTDGLILETECLLRDIGFMAEIQPLVEGEILLQSEADIYTSLENKKDFRRPSKLRQRTAVYQYFRRTIVVAPLISLYCF